MKKRQGQKGFTLIELMIVVAVIGVLTAVAVPQYQNYVKKAELGVGLANIAALKTNIEDYIATEGVFPNASEDEEDFTRLGTFKDLGTGDIAIAQSGAVSAAGSITFKLNDDNSATGKAVTLTRDGNGKWKCTTTGEAAIAPAKCTPPDTEENDS
ncbi:pilin [Aliivibrio finisterrensis]|uniref:Pilin n=1 Tax=Aliivibrio finisterrensis TaxID=511998 RepID=A0A6N6RS00_9GAMM|nr:pilin [Aliivibrio finisterrensis]KAB2824374.1 pilin [Aliivibrio finisterrensis]